MFSCRPWIDVFPAPPPQKLSLSSGETLFLSQRLGVLGLDDGIWKFLGDKEERRQRKS